MENVRNVNAIGTRDGIAVKCLQMIEHSMISDDIMNRRLKSRERQRRYRARKKMEADSKNDFVLNQPSKPQEDVVLGGNHYNYVNCVHCKRNWKKDARNAHACKKFQEVSSLVSISASVSKPERGIRSYLVPKISVEAQLKRECQAEAAFSGSETKLKHFTRDWKAEARRKNN